MKASTRKITNSLNLIKKYLFFLETPINEQLFISLILVGLLSIIIGALIYKVYILFYQKEQKEERNEQIKVEKEVIKEVKLTPKSINKFIDLHLHLDGAITVDIAKKLAALQNIALPTNDDKELKKLLTVPEGCKNLIEFLKCFAFPLSLMQTPEGLTEAVKLVSENIKSQGVIYAEIRFAPQLHTKQKMTQEDAILAALKGIKQTSLKVNLILCFMRGKDTEKENKETLELARKYKVNDGGVVALDIAGDEYNYPIHLYEDLFAKAREYGIPFTIHAGEAAGPENVRNAVRYGASRIGHGVRANDDQDLVDQLVNLGITLEVCPTSNSQTQAISDFSKYPFMHFLNKGVRVTLNTDDMGIEGTYLAKEFELMENMFNLTYDNKKTILLNSVNAAFTTNEVKLRLKNELGL